MERYLLDLLIAHGVPMLFLLQALGVFGVPMPAELVLTVSGALVRRGELDGPGVLGAAIAGSLTGVTLSYALGRVFGPRILARLDARLVSRGQEWLNRSGKWLLVFACFVPGIRHVAPVLVGSASLDFRVFAGYSYPGVVLWSAGFVAAGYSLGEGWRRAAIGWHTHLLLASITLTALASGGLLLTRRWLR